MNAFYRFRFYELDQSVAICEERDFAFFFDPNFTHVPKEDWLRIYTDMTLVFANSLGTDNFFRYPCRINEIYHPQLGNISSINTRGLDGFVA